MRVRGSHESGGTPGDLGDLGDLDGLGTLGNLGNLGDLGEPRGSRDPGGIPASPNDRYSLVTKPSKTLSYEAHFVAACRHNAEIHAGENRAMRPARGEHRSEAGMATPRMLYFVATPEDIRLQRYPPRRQRLSNQTARGVGRNTRWSLAPLWHVGPPGCTPVAGLASFW